MQPTQATRQKLVLSVDERALQKLAEAEPDGPTPQDSASAGRRGFGMSLAEVIHYQSAWDAQRASGATGDPIFSGTAQASATGPAQAAPGSSHAVPPTLDEGLLRHDGLKARWDAFTRLCDTPKFMESLNFIADALNAAASMMLRQRHQASTFFQAAGKEQREHIDRGLDSDKRRKENNAALVALSNDAQNKAVLQSGAAFMRCRDHLRTLIEHALQHATTYMYATNDAEKAARLQQLWQDILPLFTSEDPAVITQACEAHRKKFVEFLGDSAFQACMPAATLPPCWVSQPRLPHPMALPSHRRERCCRDLHWLAQALRTIEKSLGTPWVVRNPAEVRSACHRLLQAAGRVQHDLLENLRQGCTDVALDTTFRKEKEAELKRCIEQLRPLPLKRGGERKIDNQQALVEIEVLFKAFQQGGVALAELYQFAMDQTEGLRKPFREEKDPLPEDAAAAGTASQDPDACQPDCQPFDPAPADEDDGARSSAPVLPDPPVAHGGAMDPARQPLPSRKQKHMLRQNAVLPDASPQFRFFPVALVAARLDAMRHSGRMADTEMLGHIAEQMLSAQVNAMDETSRQDLLESLLPHLQACSANSCSVGFAALRPLLRVARGSENGDLRARFVVAVAENFLLKSESPQEVSAFTRLVMSGEAFELLHQLRGMQEDYKAAVFEHLARFFEHAQSIGPAEFTNALERRVKGDLDGGGKARVSISRIIGSLADHVPSPHVSSIASRAAALHRQQEPPARIADSRDGWIRHAMRLWKQDGKRPPYYVPPGGGPIEINAHDAGVMLTEIEVRRHLGSPPDRNGRQDRRSLLITVGNEHEKPLHLHGETLRGTIAGVVQAHAGWVLKNKGKTKVMVSWQGPPAEPVALPQRAT